MRMTSLIFTGQSYVLPEFPSTPSRLPTHAAEARFPLPTEDATPGSTKARKLNGPRQRRCVVNRKRVHSSHENEAKSYRDCASLAAGRGSIWILSHRTAVQCAGEERQDCVRRGSPGADRRSDATADGAAAGEDADQRGGKAVC